MDSKYWINKWLQWMFEEYRKSLYKINNYKNNNYVKIDILYFLVLFPHQNSKIWPLCLSARIALGKREKTKL